MIQTNNSYATLISAAQLTSIIRTKDATIFDCSFDLADGQAGKNVYHAGHIPGATYLHLDQDLSSKPRKGDGRHPLPEVDMLGETLSNAGVNEDRQVVVYDRSGGIFAARLWWLLKWLGHDAVAVLDGGVDAWLAAGGDLTVDIPSQDRRGRFRPKVQKHITVSAAEILTALGTPRYLLIDARSPERFRGEPHPLDPVAGHIPGAQNRYYQDNLESSGFFKPAETLEQEFCSVIRNDTNRNLVLYCGSGVTACHNALSMVHAGRPMPFLYPGSWSEWTFDPTRPTELM